MMTTCFARLLLLLLPSFAQCMLLSPCRFAGTRAIQHQPRSRIFVCGEPPLDDGNTVSDSDDEIAPTAIDRGPGVAANGLIAGVAPVAALLLIAVSTAGSPCDPSSIKSTFASPEACAW